MRTPLELIDHNALLGERVNFRPVDIFDASGAQLFRLSDGPAGVALAKDLVGSVNSAARLKVALNDIRMAVVTAIAFLGRDKGTSRIDGTIDQLCALLIKADELITTTLESTEIK